LVKSQETLQQSRAGDNSAVTLSFDSSIWSAATERAFRMVWATKWHTERVGAGGHLLIKVGIGALAGVLSPVSAFAVQKAFMVL